MLTYDLFIRQDILFDQIFFDKSDTADDDAGLNDVADGQAEDEDVGVLVW